MIWNLVLGIFDAKEAYAGLIVQRPLYIGLDTGLVGFWTFDQQDMAGERAYDRSGNSNTGLLTNGPARAVGRIGQGLNFDGSDDYVDTNTTVADNLTNWSISVWLKSNVADTGNYCAVCKDNEFSTDDDALVGINPSADATARRIGVFHQEAVSPFASTLANDTADIVVGQWYHAVATSDGNTLKLFVDGVLKASTARGGGPLTLNDASGVRLAIGARNGSGGRIFNGLIDDVRVYNRALSPDEIKRLYKIGATLKVGVTPKDVLTSGLVGYWTFDGPDMSDTTGAAPTFIQEAETAWNTSTTPKTTASFSVQVGDILVAFAASENNTTALSTPTNSGTALTWTLQQSISVTDYTSVSVWTTTATVAESITVTFARTGDALAFGGNVLTFRGSGGVGVSSKTNVASGAPTLNLTTTQANSAIVVFNADWVVVDGASRTWRTNAGALTEQTYQLTSGSYTTYGGYHADAGVVGTYAVGLSAPGAQKYAIVAVEIKGTAVLSTASDRSGNNNRGTLTNGPTRAAGKIGQGMNFDGSNDYVDIGSGSSLDDLGALTACAWVNPRSFGGGTYGRIYDKNIYAFNLDNDATPPSQTIRFSVGYDTTDVARSAQANFITLNRWQFTCATWNGGSAASGVRLYVDGIESSSYGDESNGTVTRLSDASASGFIGNRSDATRTFDGAIDDVRIYNRALSPDEIKRLYKIGATLKVGVTPKDTLTAGLVGHWTFDGPDMTDTIGAAGTLAIDASSPIRFAGAPSDNVDITSASFTPPANSLLAVCVSADTSNGVGIDVAVSASTGVSFTNRVERDFDDAGAQNGHASIWTAIQTTSTSMTVSARRTTTGGGDNQISVKVYVVTGINTTTPTGAVGEGSSTTNDITPNAYTSTVDNSLGIGCAADWVANNGTPTSTDVEDGVNYTDVMSVISLYKAAVTTPSGTAVTMNFDAGGTAAAAWNWAGLEVAPSSGSVTSIANDRSGNGNKGTLTNGPTRAIGKIGQGMNFDGTNDYVDVANESNFDITGAVTLSVWYRDGTQNASNNEYLIAKPHDANSALYWITFRTTTNQLTVGIRWGAAGANTTLVNFVDSRVHDGNWHHAAVVFDTSSVYLYFDGAQTSSVAAGGSSIITNNNAVKIGSYDGSSLFTDGTLDDVRVYNRALSPDEIKRLYNMGR